MHPIFLLVVGAIFLFSVVIVQLFLYRNDRLYLNLLLSIAISGIIWYAMIYLLTNSGNIRSYPALFNKGLPLYYLIAPSLYLYIRGSLNSELAGFSKSHLLHLLIAIPAIFSIMPYSLLAEHHQRIIVECVISDMHFAFSNSPYIVNPLHWLAFPLSAVVYSIFQHLTIHKAAKARSSSFKTIIWLYVFTAILTLIFVCMLVISALIFHRFSDAWFILHKGNLVFLMCLCMLALSFLFFVHPEFIYGLKKNVPHPVTLPGSTVLEIIDQNQEKPIIKNRMVDEVLVLKVESFMMDKQVFRQLGLTLSSFASLIDVPNHKLTWLFNTHYQLSFNNYINSLRIKYAKERLDHGDWKLFTFEAIAQDAGFSTRNTFFVAFKKVTGMTPSAYVSTLK